MQFYCLSVRLNKTKFKLENSLPIIKGLDRKRVARVRLLKKISSVNLAYFN